MKTRKMRNKPLEKWWSQLAEGKAVLIYKNGRKRSTLKKQWNQWDADDSIVDVLTSARSHDAYDVLYSKAKDKTVKEVLSNYKKYFKPIYLPALKKVRVPL